MARCEDVVQSSGRGLGHAALVLDLVSACPWMKCSSFPCWSGMRTPVSLRAATAKWEVSVDTMDLLFCSLSSLCVPSAECFWDTSNTVIPQERSRCWGVLMDDPVPPGPSAWQALLPPCLVHHRKTVRCHRLSSSKFQAGAARSLENWWKLGSGTGHRVMLAHNRQTQRWCAHCYDSSPAIPSWPCLAPWLSVLADRGERRGEWECRSWCGSEGRGSSSMRGRMRIMPQAGRSRRPTGVLVSKAHKAPGRRWAAPCWLCTSVGVGLASICAVSAV